MASRTSIRGGDHGVMRDRGWAAAGRPGPTATAEEDIDKLSRKLGATVLSDASSHHHQSRSIASRRTTTSTTNTQRALQILDNLNSKFDATVLSDASSHHHQSRPITSQRTTTSTTSAQRALQILDNMNVRKGGGLTRSTNNTMHLPTKSSKQSGTSKKTNTHSTSSRVSSSLQSSVNVDMRKGGVTRSTNVNAAMQLPKKSSKQSGGTGITKKIGTHSTSLTEKSSQAWPKDRLERIAEALPEGWEMRMSRSQGKPYYLSPSTGVITWSCPVPLDSMNEPVTKKEVAEKPAILCVGHGRICNAKISGETIRSNYADREADGQGYQCSKCGAAEFFCPDCAYEWGSFCAGMMCEKFYCDSCTPDYLGELGDDQYCGRTCMGKHHPDYRKYCRHRVAHNSDNELHDNDEMEVVYGYRQCIGITKKGWRCEIKSTHDLLEASPLTSGDDFCLYHGGKLSEKYDSDY